MKRTLNQIREDGLLALREKLGRAGMVRFLQQFELGSGDYAVSRRAWADGLTLDGIKRQVQKGHRGRSKR
jgi:hypothetical protein